MNITFIPPKCFYTLQIKFSSFLLKRMKIIITHFIYLLNLYTVDVKNYLKNNS